MEKPRIRIYFKTGGIIFYQLLNCPDLELEFCYLITHTRKYDTGIFDPESVRP